MNIYNAAVSRAVFFYDKEKVIPIAAVCAGQTIWGFSYIFSKMAMDVSSPEILLSIRYIIAFALMNVLCLTGKFKVSFKGKKNIKSLFIMGLLEPVYFYFESYGILYTNATFSGVIMSVVPIVSILFAVIFIKEYPTKKQALFCLLPIAGVIIMTISGSALGIVSPIGVILLLCTCVASASYKTVNRKSAEDFTAFERTYIVMFISSVIFTISALVSVKGDLRQYINPVFNFNFIVPVLILSIFCSVVANVFVNYAAGKISVAKLSTFGTLTTIWSMFAGVLFLNEPMTVLSFIGSIFILIGIWQVTKAKDINKQEKNCKTGGA